MAVGIVTVVVAPLHDWPLLSRLLVALAYPLGFVVCLTSGAELFTEHTATAVYPVPGGGQMFRQYALPQGAMDVDAFVSVQKLKNHAFMGVTLCLKNLFGLVPQEPQGRARQYYHHLVRMPYVMADIGCIFDPALNVIDALVSQAGREWGHRSPGLRTR